MAGYSSKPLIKKLGVKDGNKIYLVNSPKNYEKELSNIENKNKIIEQDNNFVDFI